MNKREIKKTTEEPLTFLRVMDLLTGKVEHGINARVKWEGDATGLLLLAQEFGTGYIIRVRYHDGNVKTFEVKGELDAAQETWRTIVAALDAARKVMEVA